MKIIMPQFLAVLKFILQNVIPNKKQLKNYVNY